jgi:hypothetical protein
MSLAASQVAPGINRPRPPVAQRRRPQAVADRLASADLARSRSSVVQRPAADADRLQAEYFLRLLAENHGQLGQRIDEYQKAIAIAQVRGATDDVTGIRQVMRIAEHERRTLGKLIDRLRQRFRVGL